MRSLEFGEELDLRDDLSNSSSIVKGQADESPAYDLQVRWQYDSQCYGLYIFIKVWGDLCEIDGVDLV